MSRSPRSRRRSSRDRSRIDVVPLIDVIFLLLCFFVLMSISMVIQQGIFVDLAGAESGSRARPEVRPAVVSVDERGQLHLDKTPLSAKALKTRLKRRHERSDDLRVLINADRDARHRDVVRALDVVRSIGIEAIVFTVRPRR